MDSPAIVARNVTVEYFIPEFGYSGIKEYLIRFIRGKTQVRTLRALSQVSLEIERGESVALLGHNGSGKSTFLKVLAGIIQPRDSNVQVRGRIAPMIELGTGFDGELSGFENIFLSCTLLGLSKEEIQSRVDEIISFAELEQFIHMPLKNYSSGMQARLGFACATAIDPDVLLVDEVLSVGDSNFSKKCLARIEKLKATGTTVVLVSHDANTVKAFCSRGFVFHEGELKFSGHILEALEFQDQLMFERYLSHLPADIATEEARKAKLRKTDASSGQVLPIVSVQYRLLQNGESISDYLDVSRPFELMLEATVTNAEHLKPPVSLGFSFQTTQGVRIFGTNNINMGLPWNVIEGATGEQKFACIFGFGDDLKLLRAGSLELVVGVHDSNLTRTCFIAKIAEFACKNMAFAALNHDGDLMTHRCEASLAN